MVLRSSMSFEAFKRNLMKGELKVSSEHATNHVLEVGIS